MAFIFTFVILASLSDKLDQRALRTREIIVAAGGLLAASGFVAGWRALLGGRSVGYTGVFGRAAFGVITNALLVCLAVLGIGTFMRVGKQLQKLTAQQQSPARISFEAVTARLARTQKTLDRLATNQQGDPALVAATSSELLRQLRMLGDDYAAKTKLMNLQLASEMGEASSKDALEAKKLIARGYLEANNRLAEFSTNRNELYRQSLVKAGVSTNSMETAVNAFNSKGLSPKPWEANRKLGEAHLACLQFLETNWGRWSYTNGQIVFQTESLKQDYTNLQAQVTQAYQELVNLQRKTNTTQPE